MYRIHGLEFGEFARHARIVAGNIKHRVFQRRPDAVQPVPIPGSGRDPEGSVTEIATAKMDGNDGLAASAQILHRLPQKIADFGARRKELTKRTLASLPARRVLAEISDQIMVGIGFPAGIVQRSEKVRLLLIDLGPRRSGQRIVKVEKIAADPIRRFRDKTMLLRVKAQEGILQNLVSEFPVDAQRAHRHAALQGGACPRRNRRPEMMAEHRHRLQGKGTWMTGIEGCGTIESRKALLIAVATRQDDPKLQARREIIGVAGQCRPEAAFQFRQIFTHVACQLAGTANPRGFSPARAISIMRA